MILPWDSARLLDPGFLSVWRPPSLLSLKNFSRTPLLSSLYMFSWYGFTSMIFSWYFFYLSEEHPSMSRTGPIYINCPQLNNEPHMTLTPINIQVCMIYYMVTLPIYPAHTQTLRWSKTGPLIFCSKSTPLHVHLIFFFSIYFY